jgi:hypothetical protein
MTATFFRLLHEDDKGEALADAVNKLYAGQPDPHRRHTANPSSFGQIPGSPHAYWVSARVRGVFSENSSFENDARTARQGLATADDFRFLRLWWEPIPSFILGPNSSDQSLSSEYSSWREQTFNGRNWVHLAKGGAFSKFYSDLYLLMNWAEDGAELRGFQRAVIRNPNHYFRPGLTWPRRTSGLSFRVLPTGCAFADKGPSIFVEDDNPSILFALSALLNSQAFYHLMALQVARVSLAQSFEVGLVQSTPVPNLDHEVGQRLEQLATEWFHLKRNTDAAQESVHSFKIPTLVLEMTGSLRESLNRWQSSADETRESLLENQQEIDNVAYNLYGISDEDRAALEASLNSSVDQEVAEAGDTEEEAGPASVDADELVDQLLSWAVGCVLGRWDVRMALDDSLIPELQDPFDPLPVCSPGTLIGPDGLPAERGGIVSEEWLRSRPNVITLPEDGSVDGPTISDAEYPLEIEWDGILVEGDGHPHDIVARVRDVLQVVWGDRADDIEQEAREILGVDDLRDYLRNPRKFWDSHVSRYSKSRRKAPIYWLLQSARRNFGIWLYYHRMDADILFKALRNYVDPVIALEQNRLEDLRARLSVAEEAGGRARRDADRAVDRQQALVQEIQEFREKLERVAHLGLTVDHDDGVLLSIAPLHELVPWKPAKQAWDELVAGKYEWSTMSKQMREKGLVRGRAR